MPSVPCRKIPPPACDTTVPVPRPSQAMIHLVYHELRQLARVHMRRLPGGGETLQPTALVHEAYLRLNRQPGKRWQSRRHFYHAAALAMRCILVDRFKSRKARKHGGDWQRTGLSVSRAGNDDALFLSREDLVLLDRALTRLQDEHPDLAEMVHMRFFCGFTVAEIASLLCTSVSSIERQWVFARAWLGKELGGPG